MSTTEKILFGTMVVLTVVHINNVIVGIRLDSNVSLYCGLAGAIVSSIYFVLVLLK